MTLHRLGNLSQYDLRGGQLRQRYIYFAVIGKYMKVGFSVNPKARVKALMSGALERPADLDMAAPRDIVRMFPGGPELEFEAHVALCEFQVTGEWFLAEPAALHGITHLKPREFPHIVRPEGPFHDFMRDYYADLDRSLGCLVCLTSQTPAGDRTPAVASG